MIIKETYNLEKVLLNSERMHLIKKIENIIIFKINTNIINTNNYFKIEKLMKNSENYNIDVIILNENNFKYNSVNQYKIKNKFKRIYFNIKKNLDNKEHNV